MTSAKFSDFWTPSPSLSHSRNATYQYCRHVLATPLPPPQCGRQISMAPNFNYVLGPKLIFVTGLVIFVTAVAILVCPDLLG